MVTSSGRNVMHAYAGDGLDVEVSSASPHKLVLMLFNGAIVAIGRARIHMQQGDIAEKGMLIGKAISIVDEGLRNSLNLQAGGDVAANLKELYEYVCAKLLEANLKNDPELLDHVSAILQELRAGWEEMGQSLVQQQAAASAAPPEAGRQVSLSYGKV